MSDKVIKEIKTTGIKIERRSGVYKILSPTGRIYIGKAVNIFYRFRDYRYLKCKSQTLLYRSLMKYGPESHVFVVIEYCPESELLEKEKFYVAEFQSNAHRYAQVGGLNMTDGGEGSTGYKHTDLSKIKMSESSSERVRSKESNLKRSQALMGRKAHENLIKKLKGAKQSEDHKNKRLSVHLKKVINTETGHIYASAKEAANTVSVSYRTFIDWLHGRYKNKSSLLYLDNYE